MAAAQKLKEHTLVTDTGANTEYLEKYQDQELSPEVIDEIYRETIKQGVIDHHSVDAFLASRGQRSEKCATQMVLDYADTVKEAIVNNGIKKVETHYDSDLDAVASAYLTKSLIDQGELPEIAGSLAAITNETDYGRLNERGAEFNDPEKFVKTLPGVFGSLKTRFNELASERIAKEGFSPAILAEAEAARNEAFFEVLNAAEAKGMDLTGDISELDSELSASTRENLDKGREIVKAEYEQFNQDFAQAAKGEITITDQAGKDMKAKAVVGESDQPLSFTNLSYLRTTPDTVVAVFAGAKRKSGDNYDIGIQPDMARTMDLRGLCLALNKAEMKKRQEILAKPEEERNDKEKEMVKAWSEQDDREAFTGLKDMIAQGELAEDEVPMKDPTVLVAGGSLIAASRTSLLEAAEFKKVVSEYLQM